MVVLLYIFMETITFFKNTLMNSKLKKKIFEIEISIINVFTITFNVSLLNKTIIVFIILTDPKHIFSTVC